MNEVKKKERAGVYANEAFICIETCSGYRSCIADPSGRQFLLSPSASNAELGSAILEALACSRFVLPEQAPELFDYRLITSRYAEWAEKLRSAYRFKSKRALFKNMIHCSIERDDDSLRIEPTTHEKLESWSGAGIGPEDHVVVSTAASPGDLGAALAMALERCL